jgi:hypothetical protein
MVTAQAYGYCCLAHSSRAEDGNLVQGHVRMRAPWLWFVAGSTTVRACAPYIPLANWLVGAGQGN